MNKFEFFTPLMHKNEYKFIEKFLTPDDILLEYGSGSGSIYFSGLVKKAIAIEHDIDWYNTIKTSINTFNVTNLDLYHVPGKHVDDQKLYRHIAFEDYIKFPKTNNLEFTKVLVDGRARKHCAAFISEIIDENVIVFVHDFNHNDVEGYIDENYFTDILKHFDILDFEHSGQGIIALKKKLKQDEVIVYETRDDMIKSFDKHKIMAEVGVFRGDFSKVIYDNLEPKKLHLIDIFEGITHSGIEDGKSIVSTDLSVSYKNLEELYKGKNVELHKGMSSRVLTEFDDDYFDIVYIDADHRYNAVKKDLEISYNKVKIGGIISGHDYAPANHPEVYIAVNLFCKEKNLKVKCVTKDIYTSFAIIKTH